MFDTGHDKWLAQLEAVLARWRALTGEGRVPSDDEREAHRADVVALGLTLGDVSRWAKPGRRP